MTACADSAKGRLRARVNTALGCMAALAFSACAQVASSPGIPDVSRLDDASQAQADPRVAAFANGVDHPQWLYVLRHADTITGSPAERGDSN